MSFPLRAVELISYRLIKSIDSITNQLRIANELKLHELSGTMQEDELAHYKKEIKP